MGWYCSCAVASMQGKMEGLWHLERVAQLEEPEDTKSKAHYYDGLFLLSSHFGFLFNEGQKAEALKYLQKVAAYDPRYNVYLEDLENDVDGFAVHLASGRISFGVSEKLHRLFRNYWIGEGSAKQQKFLIGCNYMSAMCVGCYYS